MRRSGFVCIMMALVIAGGAFAAATAPKPAAKPAPAEVIRAKRIELTDDQGNVRVAIGITSDGAAIIKLLDKDGNPTVALRSDDGLGLLTAEGKRKLVVGSAGAGYGVGVYDSKGNPRAELTMVKDEPMMVMRDSSGNFRAEMFLINDDPVFNLSDGKGSGASVRLKLKGSSPSMLLTDGNGKARGECSLADDGAPRLLFANSAGTSCLQLLLSNGDPILEVMHPNGQPAAMMGITGAEGFFRTSDTDNNTLWQNP